VYVKNMAKLDKDDLAQMNEDYFKSLEKERLVEVAKNLHQLATDLWEKQQQNSENSSQPPSQDNPYVSLSTTEESNPSSESESATIKTEQKQREESQGKEQKKNSDRKPGKQQSRKRIWSEATAYSRSNSSTLPLPVFRL
jgi:hypothetical protein